MFFKIRHYVSSDTLKLLYYSLFYSFISYGIIVWGLTHPTILDCLFRLQKRVVRAISFKDIYAHSTPLFYKLKLLKLFDIHTLNLLSRVYEYQNNQSVQPFDDYFTPLYSVHNYNTRQAFKGDIYVPGTNTTQYGKINLMEQFGIVYKTIPFFICIQKRAPWPLPITLYWVTVSFSCYSKPIYCHKIFHFAFDVLYAPKPADCTLTVLYLCSYCCLHYNF